MFDGADEGGSVVIESYCSPCDWEQQSMADYVGWGLG